ncbi:MAG TPA: hypothetical protein VED17_04170 [Nitrososphaerales archaeon]|nr:hypothetical protein [Nitrososphaerales archaeon]
MQNYDQLQEQSGDDSQRPVLPSKIPQLESLKISESFADGLRHDFFGTKPDKEKSFFVFSMIILIIGFFVLSAVNLALDIVVGLTVVCYGLYGGIRWTRKFLKEML